MACIDIAGALETVPSLLQLILLREENFFSFLLQELIILSPKDHKNTKIYNFAPKQKLDLKGLRPGDL